jgi:chemotaxis methyl-accepting protein methylase
VSSVLDTAGTLDEVAAAARLLEQETGIVIPAYRYPVLTMELERLGGSGGVSRGVELLVTHDRATRKRLISAVSVPETYLFRHAGHFRLLKKHAAQRQVRGLATRVLSAGCSTGEEAWSIAAVLASLPVPGQEHAVVGWDLNPERLRLAAAGRYRPWSNRRGLLGYDRFFRLDKESLQVDPCLRSLVTFEAVNLLTDWPPVKTPFDVIFFRNVAIYWSIETIEEVSANLVAFLARDGVLCIGPTDPLSLPRNQWTDAVEEECRAFRRLDSKSAPAIPRVEPQRPRPRAISKEATTPKRKPLWKVPPPAPAPPPPPQPTMSEASAAHSILEQVRTLADQGRYQEALGLLTDNPVQSSTEGKLWSGIISLSMNRPRDALRFFRQCAYLRPDDPEYRRWLAATYRALGLSAEADREMRTAAALLAENGKGDIANKSDR